MANKPTMPLAMRLLLGLIVLLIVYVAYQLIRTQHYITVGTELAHKAVAYSQHPKNPTFRILMVGDSTGVGTGASSPETSLAGLVGKKYPHADLINASVNGAKTRDVIKQLELTPGNFDLVMIESGGNDSVRFTDLHQTANDLQVLLTVAAGKGKHVLVTSTGNIGTAPLFPAPTRWLIQRQTLAVRAVYLKIVAAQTNDVRYTDLYTPPKDDPFAKDPPAYYAADFFHPSSLGYALWFKYMSVELDHFGLS